MDQLPALQARLQSLLNENQQILLIVSICLPLALTMVLIIVRYSKITVPVSDEGKSALKGTISPRGRQSLVVNSRLSIKPFSQSSQGGPDAEVQNPSQEQDSPVAAAGGVQTCFNLEEFMLRATKLGFQVTRIKDNARKKRLLGLTKTGDVVLHKLGSGKINQASVRLQRPYWKLSLRSIADCFECAEASEPSLIMDFSKKMLHLGVDSLLDRDYMVKGFRLLMQRLQQNSTFFSGSGKAAPSSLQPSSLHSSSLQSRTPATSGAATAQAMMNLPKYSGVSSPSSVSGNYMDHDDEDNDSVISCAPPPQQLSLRDRHPFRNCVVTVQPIFLKSSNKI